jgi:8-oxo-dGTP diphosphatase
MLWIREYIGRNHEFAEQDADFHQIEFMFVCALVTTEGLGAGHLLDDGQVGIEWLPLDTLEQVCLYPAALRPMLRSAPNSADMPVYLGDVN